jgi:hypothetical protein
MGERKAAAAGQHERCRDRHRKAAHHSVFGQRRHAADQQIKGQASERYDADGKPARDEALVPAALEGVIPRRVVDESGKPRLDRRDGLVDTQTTSRDGLAVRSSPPLEGRWHRRLKRSLRRASSGAMQGFCGHAEALARACQ